VQAHGLSVDWPQDLLHYHRMRNQRTFHLVTFVLLAAAACDVDAERQPFDATEIEEEEEWEAEELVDEVEVSRTTFATEPPADCFIGLIVPDDVFACVCPDGLAEPEDCGPCWWKQGACYCEASPHLAPNEWCN
jgi:hypothetical protein